MAANNIPTVLVIFGATGDLMAKKIAPALFHLHTKKKLPLMFRIISVARRPFPNESFRAYIKKLLIDHKIDKNDKHIESFVQYFFYHQGDFENKDSYESLARTLGRIDGEWKVCSNKLFYLAVPPLYVKEIFDNLASSGLTIACSSEEGWTRVIVEKPFGRDLKTAEELDLLLGKLFQEEQIYRIDHYLAKEMLQNILTFRFSNNLLEQSWNSKFIEKIEIRAHETIGVEDRGTFYDGVGALRDYGQNHLLQMLALVTMEQPRDFQATTVRKERLKLLNNLRVLSDSAIQQSTMRAQYRGYRSIKGVRAASQTETFFQITAFLENARWRGVPITLESGKKLKKPLKEIVVTFKHHTPCFCPKKANRHFQNSVTFSLEPKESIRIKLLSKLPGLDLEVGEQRFTFLYRNRAKKTQHVEEYEKLLLDCIEGNQLLFLSTGEVQATWRYIDPIMRAWEKNKVQLLSYLPDTNTILKKSERQKMVSMKKEVGIIGLGKMGANLAQQLLDARWRVVGYNRSFEKTKQLEKNGLVATHSLEKLVQKLQKPRVVFILLPAGDPIDSTLSKLIKLLDRKDIIVESGNSFFKDTLRRGEKIIREGIDFIDVGISGGPKGVRHGACLMVGGNKKTFEYLLPLFTQISVAGGVEHFEGIGAGHFVKMIHNGIEYGMMQAIAEGFTILKQSNYQLDLTRISEIYSHGSVIESRLISWLKEGFALYGANLADVSGRVARGGQGSRGEADWAIETSQELKIKTKVIEEAVKFRTMSEKNPNYTGKLINTMRAMFGGHSVK